MNRNRLMYILVTCAVISLGLASRQWVIFPAGFGKYPGDALYALMVFCGLGWLLPRRSTAHNALIALAFSFAIEFGQLYHAPWIDSIRATTLGHLVLGSHFGWWDLVAYVIGVASGAIGERLVSRAGPAIRATHQPTGGSGR